MQYDNFDPIKMTQTELRVQFVSMRTELKYKDETLRDIKQQLFTLQNQPKKRGPIWKMFLAFFISMLFGITSIMFNVGTNMLSSKDAFGNTLLVLAGIIFCICTLISTFIVGGSSL